MWDFPPAGNGGVAQNDPLPLSGTFQERSKSSHLGSVPRSFQRPAAQCALDPSACMLCTHTQLCIWLSWSLHSALCSHYHTWVHVIIPRQVQERQKRRRESRNLPTVISWGDNLFRGGLHCIGNWNYHSVKCFCINSIALICPCQHIRSCNQNCAQRRELMKHINGDRKILRALLLIYQKPPLKQCAAIKRSHNVLYPWFARNNRK